MCEFKVLIIVSLVCDFTVHQRARIESALRYAILKRIGAEPSNVGGE